VPGDLVGVLGGARAVAPLHRFGDRPVQAGLTGRAELSVEGVADQCMREIERVGSTGAAKELRRERFVERVERGRLVDPRHLGGQIEAKRAGEPGRRAE
jgi:hypothetical protein